MAVANQIKEFRKANGLTQAELASRMHVSRQTIAAMEKGLYVPSLELALDIAHFFGLQVEQLFRKLEEK